MSLVLALDIATKTGFCHGEPGSRPRYGSVLLRGEGASDGSLLAAMADWMGNSLKLFNPTAVAYEAPLPGGQHSSINAGKIALRLSGIVELVCWRRSIRCDPIHVKTVRAQVIGNGNCKKPDVSDWVDKQGWPVPMWHGEPDYDACDAIAVWGYATGLRVKR